MRATTPALIVLAALLTWPESLSAQSQSPAPPSQAAAATPQEPKPAAPADDPERTLFQPYVTLGSTFDSNIDHDRRDTDSVGGVFGAGFFFLNESDDVTLEMNAEVAGHGWTNTSRWDRFSGKVTASYERDLPGRWSVDTSGEVSQKGSSEDRELSDQYVVVPRIAFRLSSQNRLRVYSGLRSRRYDDDPNRNAFNRYIGIDFTERAQPDRRWELDLRYEVNETRRPRNHYNRWTLGIGYTLPAGDTIVETEVRYRMHYYPFRVVEVDDVDVNRRDHRWIPRVMWTLPITPVLALRAGYTFETRTSNDLDREFSAHLYSIAFVRRW